MIELLDKVIYGLGAMTLFGLLLIASAFLIISLVAIVSGLKDSFSRSSNKNNKTFGGKNG